MKFRKWFTSLCPGRSLPPFFSKVGHRSIDVKGQDVTPTVDPSVSVPPSELPCLSYCFYGFESTGKIFFAKMVVHEEPEKRLGILELMSLVDQVE